VAKYARTAVFGALPTATGVTTPPTERQSNNVRSDITITIWIEDRTVASIVSVSVGVNAGLNVDELA
jgi:hypothetical protein